MPGRNGVWEQAIFTSICGNSASWGECLSRLRIIDARKMEKLLFKLGFERVRQKGSHVFYRHPDGKCSASSRKRFGAPVDKRDFKGDRAQFRWIWGIFGEVVNSDYYYFVVYIEHRWHGLDGFSRIYFRIRASVSSARSVFYCKRTASFVFPRASSPCEWHPCKAGHVVK